MYFVKYYICLINNVNIAAVEVLAWLAKYTWDNTLIKVEAC